MKKSIKILVYLVPVFVLIFTFDFVKTIHALTTNQLALSSSGSLSGLGTGSLQMTPNGRYIAYDSSASYIVSGDSNAATDVFVRDTLNGASVRVSVDSGGSQANGDSNFSYITNNGRYVLFRSTATNLATITGINPTYYTAGIYMRDTVAGTTQLIKAGYSDISGFDDYVIHSSSEDARFIYYTKLSQSDHRRAYMLDTLLSSTTEISTAADGVTSGTGTNQDIKNSCDGRFAVFQSNASNLVPSDTNSVHDIFLVDNMNGHTIRNLTINGNNTSSDPSMACDGNNVYFMSDSSNLVSGDTNSATDAFSYNIPTDTIERVSLGTSSAQLSGGAYNYKASADGSYIAFGAYDSVTGRDQVYMHNRLTDTTILVSQDGSSNAANGDSVLKGMTYDGKGVVYHSRASNLGVSNPGNTNNYMYLSDI